MCNASRSVVAEQVSLAMHFPCPVYVIDRPDFLPAVPVKSEKDENGVDYNICCTGHMSINRDASTAVITATIKEPAEV